MLRSETHECPQCTGAVNRENYAADESRNAGGALICTRIYLYCEHCRVGFEFETDPTGDILMLPFDERSDPPKVFRGFLQRLEDARVA